MTWNGSHAICISLWVIAAITTFDQVLDEFFASFVKESVGRAYATDSQEEAEWNSLFSVVWVA